MMTWALSQRIGRVFNVTSMRWKFNFYNMFKTYTFQAPSLKHYVVHLPRGFFESAIQDIQIKVEISSLKFLGFYASLLQLAINMRKKLCWKNGKKHVNYQLFITKKSFSMNFLPPNKIFYFHNLIFFEHPKNCLMISLRKISWENQLVLYWNLETIKFLRQFWSFLKKFAKLSQGLPG